MSDSQHTVIQKLIKSDAAKPAISSFSFHAFLLLVKNRPSPLHNSSQLLTVHLEIWCVRAPNQCSLEPLASSSDEQV